MTQAQPVVTNPLANLVAEVWSAFLDGVGIDGCCLETLIEGSGLAKWRFATEADVAASDLELEVGDQLLALTEEGRRIVREAAWSRLRWAGPP
jgi:hypothetical protein